MFYVLLSGSFDLMKRDSDGQRRLAVRETPGEFLGELPIVLGTPFFAGAVATTHIRVACFGRAQFAMLVAESPPRAEVGDHHVHLELASSHARRSSTSTRQRSP